MIGLSLVLTAAVAVVWLGRSGDEDAPPSLEGTQARPDLAAAFQDGWLEVHGTAPARRQRIADLFSTRLENGAPLIAGTQAYRRALTAFDVEDLLERIDHDPRAACQPCL